MDMIGKVRRMKLREQHSLSPEKIADAVGREMKGRKFG